MGPYLNGYVNVQADGSTGDHVEEWQMPAQNGLLTKTFSDQWSTASLVVNGVNGWSYNVTSHYLYFSAGGPAGNNEVRVHRRPLDGDSPRESGRHSHDQRGLFRGHRRGPVSRVHRIGGVPVCGQLRDDERLVPVVASEYGHPDQRLARGSTSPR